MDTNFRNNRVWFLEVYRRKDILWLLIWIGGMMLLWLWDVVFLNEPALERIQTAFLNSLLTGSIVVVFSLILGWFAGVGMHLLERSHWRKVLGIAKLAVNVLRSIPQIIAVLIGYVVLTVFLHEEIIR